MPKVAGVKVLVSIGGQVVGGQTGATLNRETNIIEVTSKESGWGESLAGIKSWSIECEGYVVLDDQSYNAMEEAWEDGETVDVSIVVPGGKTYAGEALIGDFPLEAPQDDAMTFSITLTGTGVLTKTVSAP